MGREIRRVPPDWEHPKAQLSWGYGYRPMYDKSFDEACASWDIDPDGDRPDNPDSYRPAWPEESRTAYQIYENVSEGTPVSPIFTDEEEMVRWLVSEWGRSESAARKFVEHGWAPSFVMTGGRMSDPDAGAWEPEFLGGKENHGNEEDQ